MLEHAAHQLGAICLQLCGKTTLHEQTKAIDFECVLYAVIKLFKI